MNVECEECLGDGYLQCPNCDGTGVIGDEPGPAYVPAHLSKQDNLRLVKDVQLQLPGVDWEKY